MFIHHKLEHNINNNNNSNHTVNYNMAPMIIPHSHFCGSSRGSLRFCKYILSAEGCSCLPEVPEKFTFDCGQCGSSTVFAAYLCFPVVRFGWEP